MPPHEQLAPPLDLAALPGQRHAQIPTPAKDAPEREILHDNDDAGQRSPAAHPQPPAAVPSQAAAADPEVAPDGSLDLPAPAGPPVPPATTHPKAAATEADPEVEAGHQDLPEPAGPPALASSKAPAAASSADPEVTASGTQDLPSPAGPDKLASAADKVPFDEVGSTNATQVNDEGQATKKHAPQDKIPSLPSAAEIPTHPAGGKVVPPALELLDDLQKKSGGLPPVLQRAEKALVALLPVDLPSDLNLEAAPPPAYALDEGQRDPAISTAHHDVPGKTHDQVAVVDDGDEKAEVEKQKALRRDVLGHEPGGTVVQGIEDDHLWTMLRRLDKVRRRRIVSRRAEEERG